MADRRSQPARRSDTAAVIAADGGSPASITALRGSRLNRSRKPGAVIVRSIASRSPSVPGIIAAPSIQSCGGLAVNRNAVISLVSVANGSLMVKKTHGSAPIFPPLSEFGLEHRA